MYQYWFLKLNKIYTFKLALNKLNKIRKINVDVIYD